jgi:hypothetical protein
MASWGVRRWCCRPRRADAPRDVIALTGMIGTAFGLFLTPVFYAAAPAHRQPNAAARCRAAPKLRAPDPAAARRGRWSRRRVPTMNENPTMKQRFTRSLAPLLAAMVLAGCATVASEPPHALPAVPAAFKEARPAEGRWVVSPPAEAAARGPWWKAFADPALDAFVEQSDRDTLASSAPRRGSRRPAPSCARPMPTACPNSASVHG